MIRILFFLATIFSVSAVVQADTATYCAEKQLDWQVCQQQIKDGTRSADQPCAAIPDLCMGGNTDACVSARLDWITCQQNARDAGLEPSVCGPEPVCN